MKKIFTLLLPMLFLAMGATAQNPTKYRVNGRVMDSTKKEAVGYATIIVRDQADKPYVSTYSDDKGAFECRLVDGTYKMVIGFTGYTPDTLTVTVAGKAIELGDRYITEGLAIGAVQVLGQLITSDVDKMSYNTAADPETPALTALEMMRKVPMLTIDGEDNLQLKGQSDFKILVNGKPSTMMTKNYKDVLKSMPASSIVRIEVITNPPAKYDAEGVGGLINIITNRKSSTDGFNGSVRLSVDQWGGVGGGGYIAVESGKFALSANLNVNQYQSPKTGGSSSRIDSMSADRYRMLGGSSGWSKGLHGGLGLEASYQIDSVNLLTLSVNGWGGQGFNENEQWQDYFSNTGVETAKIKGYSKSNYNYISLGGNLDYQHTFKNPEETLTASYRFDANPEGQEGEVKADQTLGVIDPNFTYHRRSGGQNNSFEHTLQVDYYNPLTKIHQIEVGGKYIARPNSTNNNYELWDINTNNWLDDNERRKNDLDYVQHIGSFYGGYAAKLKWLTAKVGVRGELTINEGKYLIGRNSISMFNRYFNIVPYVTLNFKMDDANSIRVGYTQRINRPSIWRLNPYIDDLDPTSVNTGNPDLEATLNHNVNLNYSIYKPKWNFGIDASGYWADNAIQRVSWLVQEGEYKGRVWNTYQNIANGQNYRLGVNGGARFFDNKLNFSLNFSAYYSIIDAPKAGMHSEGFGWNGNFNAGGQPWKDANINLYVGAFSSAPGLQNQYSTYVYNGISLTQAFLKKKLRVSLSCNDPFETKKYQTSQTWGPGFSTSSESWRYGRSFRLSVQWSFGKMQAQVKKAKRGISNDDGGSGGNKGGSGGGQ